MTHDGYECCAICDKKLNRNNNCGRKEVICLECCNKLDEKGVLIQVQSDLIKWIKKECIFSYKILLGIGFKHCDSPNAVDSAMREAHLNIIKKAKYENSRRQFAHAVSVSLDRRKL